MYIYIYKDISKTASLAIFNIFLGWMEWPNSREKILSKHTDSKAVKSTKS